MMEMLAESVSDRHLVISTFDNLFKGKNFFAPQPFDNLVKVVVRIYDSYLPKSEEDKEEEFDFTDLERMRKLSKQYYQQNPAKRNKVAPCLENQLKGHKIWSYQQTWMCLSKDLEVQAYEDIKHMQNEMAGYKVNPTLFETITNKLLEEEIKCEDEEEAKQKKEECIRRIDMYKI